MFSIKEQHVHNTSEYIIIVCQNVLHALNALLNDCLIIRTAILSQQKLQHINRDIGPFLDFLCQVFTNDPAIKVAAQLLAQFLTGRPLLSCPSFPYGIPASSVSESESKAICKGNVHNDRLPPLLQTAFFVINHEVILLVLVVFLILELETAHTGT